MRRKLSSGFALSAAIVLVASGLAVAHDGPVDDGVIDSGKEVHGVAHDQHGGDAGHIFVDNYNVDLISKLKLTTAEGRIADVGVWNGFAYLGAFRQDACGGPESGEPDGGVYVVDITNPASPQKAGFIPIHQDSFAGEGIQALTITTPKFNGDLLVINAESCGKNNKGGFSLYDVTNPRRPAKLVENYGDFNVNLGAHGNDANDIHSAFVWEDDNNTAAEIDDRAYVVTTDDFELTDTDIFDITDPRHPFLVGEFDLNARYPAIIDPTLGPAEGFLHDMIVKKIGGHYVMLLSYWDSGYVMLNVDDPANPVFIGDSDFTNPDPELLARTGTVAIPEGNGHEAEFTADSQYIVAADEDFSPHGAKFEITAGPNAGIYPAGEFSWTPPISSLSDGILNGPTAFGGYACPGDTVPDPSIVGPLAPGEEAILVVSRGPFNDPNVAGDACFFSQKVEAAQNAGWDAVVIANHHTGSGAGASPDATLCGSQGHVFTPTIPAVCLGHRALHLLFGTTPNFTVPYPLGDPGDLEPDPGELGQEVRVETIFNGWGYVHLYGTTPNAGGKLPELDTFAIPEAMDDSFSSGHGDLSVHEAATSHDDVGLVYLSHYAGGFRVLRIESGQLNEVGAWIDPPVGVDGDEGGNNFWGVQVFHHNGHELVAASDRDFGLYIFEYTGP